MPAAIGSGTSGGPTIDSLHFPQHCCQVCSCCSQLVSELPRDALKIQIAGLASILRRNSVPCSTPAKSGSAGMPRTPLRTPITFFTARTPWTVTKKSSLPPNPSSTKYPSIPRALSSFSVSPRHSMAPLKVHVPTSLESNVLQHHTDPAACSTSCLQ